MFLNMGCKGTLIAVISVHVHLPKLQFLKVVLQMISTRICFKEDNLTCYFGVVSTILTETMMIT